MNQTTDNPMARAEAIAKTFNITNLSPEMKEEIRTRIRKSYDNQRMSKYARELCRGGLWHVDGPPRAIWLRSSQSRMAGTQSILTTLCNKTTTVYCYDKLDSQEDDYFDGSGILASCLFDEWFVYHEGKPEIEFSQFFANVVPISLKGPKSITKIIKAHVSTCNDALSCLKDIQDKQIAQGQAPKQIYDNYTFQQNFERYRLNPLYCAIFIVVDTHCPAQFEPDQTLDLNKHSKVQNVLLIRTGYESDLSAPIDFKELQDQCLPLCRPDIDMPTDWAIRVPLATAVKFISDLEHREYAAFPELRVGAPGKLSCKSAGRAEEEMNWSWEEDLKNNDTPMVPISLMKATEAVINGTPYTEDLFYWPYSYRFRGARFDSTHPN